MKRAFERCVDKSVNSGEAEGVDEVIAEDKYRGVEERLEESVDLINAMQCRMIPQEDLMSTVLFELYFIVTTSIAERDEAFKPTFHEVPCLVRAHEVYISGDLGH